jgi:hypothetical protein
VRVKTLVAHASLRAASAETASVKVKLTKAGVKLLKTHRKLKITADASFTPTGGNNPVKKSKTFVLG